MFEKQLELRYNDVRGESMIENLNDMISILLLASIPFGFFFILMGRLLKMRKAHLRANQEQYFREW